MTTDVLVERDGGTGRIRLNRPKALHALNTAMCQRITEALDMFAADAGIACVVFDHAEGRGFCAGGDIRMLAESGKDGGAEARAFFRAEYRMNHQLFTYPKPTVAVMDGVTMGGGVGVALPCRYRIATENTRFAMPETGIGLFPDVGGGWYLPRLPGEVGMYLGLTGARLDGADALALGLATHYLASGDVPAAIAALSDRGDIGAVLAAHASAAPPANITARQPEIDRLFSGDSVAGIIAALGDDGGEWAARELATLRTKSPLSMAVSFRLLREGAAMPDFAAEMRREYAVAAHMVRSHDFIEGVRALIVDKDNAPQWQPLATDADIDAIFAPLSAEEEWSPL